MKAGGHNVTDLCRIAILVTTTSEILCEDATLWQWQKFMSDCVTFNSRDLDGTDGSRLLAYAERQPYSLRDLVADLWSIG